MKRAPALAALVVCLAAIFPVSPAAAMTVTVHQVKKTPARHAPRSPRRARKVLVTDVKKLAAAFSHKHYRAVCSDLTAKERRSLGGAQKCVLKVALLTSFGSIKRFTLVKATLNRNRTRAAITARVDTSSTHVLKGTFRWQGGKYRLDHETA